MHHTLKVCSIATGSFTSVEDEDQQDSAVDVNDGEEEEDVEDGDEESAEEDEDGEEEEGKVLFSPLLFAHPWLDASWFSFSFLLLLFGFV